MKAQSGQSIDTRMKKYEHVNRHFLMPNMPTLIRLDGKAFHSFTKGMDRPFDRGLIKAMNETARFLAKNIMGVKVAFVQSDEITLLLTDYDNINTQAWFNGNIQKMVSVSASMATLAFNKAFTQITENIGEQIKTAIAYDKITLMDRYEVYRKALNKGAMFDARGFQVPKHEVVNNFIWRQQDATRNSIQLVGQSQFSHGKPNSEMYKKSCNQIQDMLMLQKGINWNDFPTGQKRGRCVYRDVYQKPLEGGSEVTRSRWIVDNDIPIFTKDREYIEKYVNLEK